jgi:dTDP-4-amino-4,6-dideoxygalactose transaminase
MSTPNHPIHIPFNRLSLVGREMEYLQMAIQSGHVSGDGSFTKRCHQLL